MEENITDEYSYTATEWEPLQATTFEETLAWGWDKRYYGNKAEKIIFEIYKAENDMYTYHCRNDEEQREAMRYSLTAQLLSHDPEIYRLTVAVRRDGHYRLLSVPSASNQSLQSLQIEKTFTSVPQLAVRHRPRKRRSEATSFAFLRGDRTQLTCNKDNLTSRFFISG